MSASTTTVTDEHGDRWDVLDGDPIPPGAVPEVLANVRNGAWLDSQTFPPLVWMVRGLLPEGFGLFTGAPKVGKSWVALDVALAVAAGGDALGVIPVDRRPVLLLALEDGERRLQGRCRHLLDGAPIPERLEFVTGSTADRLFPLMTEWLAGNPNGLVILDTLGKVMPPAERGETQYSRDYRIGSALKRLVDEHPGSCLLVVHHTRKLESTDWMDSTSGTNGLNGSADFTLSLSRPRNQDGGIFRVVGRDVPEGEYAATFARSWVLEGGSLDAAAKLAADAELRAGIGERATEILEYVNAAGGPVTPKQVDDALYINDSRTYLGRLVDQGRLSKAGRGKYEPLHKNTVATVAMLQSDVVERSKSDIATLATHVSCNTTEPLQRSDTDLLAERASLDATAPPGDYYSEDESA